MSTSVQKRLKDLIKIGESLVWSRCPEVISEATVNALITAFDCDYASVYLLDVTGDYLIQYVACGDIPKHMHKDDRLSITTGRMLHMLTTHQPLVMDFLNPDPADWIPEGPVFRSAASAPLMVGEDVLGMFTIVHKEYYHWQEKDIDYLLDVGKLLGITVQHARIARKTTDLEILLERKRLSGEIHDNLSQLISSLNMSTEAALLSWEEGNMDWLRNDLERIRTTSREAARTLREEMLSLRTPTNETKGLISGVRECTQRFKQQWGIDTELYLDNGVETLIVSTQVELQFIRILHESLANIIRHAVASRVRVVLQGDTNGLYMQIQDNGRGFDPEAVSRERLGLRIMRERAESLGGVLRVESGSGLGTTIRVDVPWYRST